MSGKVLFDGSIKSQPIDAVKAMIEFFDGKACERLPAKVQMAGGWWLILSSKKNEYHVCSKNVCSCKGFEYRRSCRHIKELREEEVLPVPLVDVFAFDTLPQEVEYWAKKEQKARGPVEGARLRAAHDRRDNIVAAMES